MSFQLTNYSVAISSILRSLGGPIRGDIRPSVGGQRSPGGRLPGKTPRTRSGCKESAEHQRDGYQAPTQAQTPQHHHFQVSGSSVLQDVAVKGQINCQSRV